MTADRNTCRHGNVLAVLPRLIESGVRVQCVVTSPPYWGLRDYGVAGQLGLEPTPEEYVGNLMRVFGLVRELLADDGVLWLNLGDSYASGYRATYDSDPKSPVRDENPARRRPGSISGLPPKNLLGLPWRVALALQADGWILRSAPIWQKPNPMPESVKDRPIKSYENIFLLAKRPRYFYDHEAVREPAAGDHPRNVDCDFQAPGQSPHKGLRKPHLKAYSFRRETGKYVRAVMPGTTYGAHRPGRDNVAYCGETRNLRDVWSIPTQPCPEAHFATFPEALAETCVKAGSRPGDLVMDPFMGSGTVAVVAERLGRDWLGVELNAEYIEIQNRRLAKLYGPLFPRTKYGDGTNG